MKVSICTNDGLRAVLWKGGNQQIMQIHNKNGENEISEFYYKRSDEDPL
jgi:hypothetical protein